MRFTFDSNILVRAVTSPGGPALRVLDFLDTHTLVLSRFILDEVERVLLYPWNPRSSSQWCGPIPMTMRSSTLLPTGAPRFCALETPAISRRQP